MSRSCNKGISSANVISKFNWGRIHFCAQLVVIGKTSSLAGSLTQGLCSSLAVGQRLLQFLVLWASPEDSCEQGNCLRQSEQGREWGCGRRKSVFYNLISEVIPTTSVILFIRSESLEPAWSWKEGTTERYKCQEMGSAGTFSGCLPQIGFCCL